jgi:hypothetical protein
MQKILASTPAEKQEETTAKLVSMWATMDMEAAGSWLNTQPEGPGKNAAAQAYAVAAAKEDPTAAMHWANTLADATDRTRTKRRVFATWFAAEPEKAAAWLPSSGWSDAEVSAAKEIMFAAQKS